MNVSAPTKRPRRVLPSKRPSRAGVPAGAAEPTADVAPPPLHAVRDTLAAVAPGLTVPQLLDRLVTVDGRIDPSIASRQLTRAERLAVQVLAAPVRATEAPAGSRTSGDKIVFKGAVGYTEAGKPFLDVPGRPPASAVVPVLAPVATLAWTADQVQRLHAETAGLAEADVAEVRRAREHLASRDGRAADAVLSVRAVLPHVAPISTYVGHRNITNLRSPRNLTGQSHLEVNTDCLMHGLENQPLDLWPDDAVLFVALARQSVDRWGPNGLEYFNGVQLSHDELTQDEEKVATPGPASGSLTIRQVDGVLRNKRVSVLRHDGASDRLLAALHPVLAAHGVPGDDPAAWAEHLRDPGSLGEAAGSRVDAFARLTEELLVATRGVTRSELAMSRGLRALDLLAGVVRTGDRAPLVACEMDDQYCCVVTDDPPGSPDAADRAWAIGSRMRYNSWHFRPWGGAAPQDLEPPELYFPPELPDITAHADFHHPGHINYRVRHALRVPRTVTVDATAFTGIVDVRLSRGDGEPYEPQDLVDATVLADLVAAAYEGLLHAELTGDGTHTVRAFDLDWFRGRYL